MQFNDKSVFTQLKDIGLYSNDYYTSKIEDHEVLWLKSLNIRSYGLFKGTWIDIIKRIRRIKKHKINSFDEFHLYMNYENVCQLSDSYFVYACNVSGSHLFVILFYHMQLVVRIISCSLWFIRSLLVVITYNMYYMKKSLRIAKNCVYCQVQKLKYKGNKSKTRLWVSRSSCACDTADV